MEVLNNQEKINSIHQFMVELTNESSTLTKPEIYKKYQYILQSIEPIDIFYLPMYQTNTTFSIEEIKETAGKFVNVFYHGLESSIPESYDSDLFLYMLKENQVIEEHLNQIKPFFKSDLLLDHSQVIIDTLEQCLQFERKYLKREMILFPMLEKYLPTTKPMEVLWSLHDDARMTLKALLSELRKDQPQLNQIIFLIGEFYNLVFGINTKEKLILFPVADRVFSEEEKQLLFEDTMEYGYVFIEHLPIRSSIDQIPVLEEGVIQTRAGSLSAQQFDAIMRYIPMDITFVDQDDKVTYFNDRKERHFPRNPSIIGRLVKHCHPPKSVQVVEQIIHAFRHGEKDIAEFWIPFNNAFLYITYYAVRSKTGTFLGTLEVSQDVTHIKSLEGQKRLLDWK